MHEFTEELKDMCKIYEREVSDYAQKFKVSGGKISVDDLKAVDLLMHTIKSVKTVEAMLEAESQGYNAGVREGVSRAGISRERSIRAPYADGAYADSSYADEAYANASYEGMSNEHYNEGAGRRERNGMGKFVSRASYGNNVKQELREIMDQTGDQMVKQKIHSIISEM